MFSERFLTGAAVCVVAVCAGQLAGDWLATAAILVLWAGWSLLRDKVGPPVLALAFTHQWMQVTIAIFYYALTGRRVQTMDFIDYRPMVLIGLGCLLALLGGLILGRRHTQPLASPFVRQSESSITLRQLIILYGAATGATGAIQQLAWAIPQLTQAILAIDLGRLALLFLIFRRLFQDAFRWRPALVLLMSEMALGFTGYFAGFREALMMGVLALLERFDRRRAVHWFVLATVGVLVFCSAIAWTGIKFRYRYELDSGIPIESRLERFKLVTILTGDWFTQDLDEISSDVDRLVERMWTIYYPALAVTRVPSLVPHENGALLWAAVKHLVTPRLLFPDKPVLESDSELVRLYSGIWVPGAEQNTSIAFGYAAESYVDFGLPWMFLPVFVYGVLMGRIHRWLLENIHSRELAVAMICAVFWLSLYLFERSWIKTLGLSATLLICLGGGTLLLDHFLLKRYRWEQDAETYQPAPV